MKEYLPLLIVGAILGVFSTVMIIAYATVKDKKSAIGFDRKMKDGDLLKRLLVYARPYWKSFLLVGFIMLVTIACKHLLPIHNTAKNGAEDNFRPA